MCISGYDRHGCCCGRLARWQCAAPAVLSRTGWVAVSARYARVARFGVRQPRCRASRACDHERVAAVTLPLSAQWDHVSAGIPFLINITRGAQFGVRQPCCRASRACDHERVAAVSSRVTETTGVQRISGWFDHPRSHILTNTVHHRRQPQATSQGFGRGRGCRLLACTPAAMGSACSPAYRSVPCGEYIEGPILNPERVLNPPLLQGATWGDTCVGATHGTIRVTLLSRGSHVTNGKRIGAAVIAVVSVCGADVHPAH